MLENSFFDRDAQTVARELLGKAIYVKYGKHWLNAQITQTEAYYLEDKASHASLGYTEKRKALFMPAGTIYMYYARGGPSFNISTQGAGNAVLIKEARIHHQEVSTIAIMQALNPLPGPRTRPMDQLCKGQTLLCKSLGLTVERWNQQSFDPHLFYLKDIDCLPISIMQSTRRGIPCGRDEHLPYRFIACF